MIRTILVPLDGSEFAEAALSVARPLARRLHASLRLLTVHDLSVLELAAMADGALIQRVDRDARAEARRYLDAQVASLTSEGLHVRADLQDGDPAATLVRYLAEHAVDLVVMSTHGRGGASRLWLGSVADRMVRQGDCPVLLVRPGALPEHPETVLAEVLVPLDGSVRAEQALPLALELSTGHVHLMTVVVPPFLFNPPAAPALGTPEAEPIQRQLLRAYRYLRRLARPSRDAGRAMSAHVELSFNPTAAILGYATQHGIDCVALGSHGRGGLARWAVGSVADKVIRSGVGAVLVCRTASVSHELSQAFRAAATEPDLVEAATPAGR